MAYHTRFAGTVRVDPPLGPAALDWVSSLRGAAAGERPEDSPGWPSPWAVDRRGHLRVPASEAAPRQVAEWLAWIAAELAEPTSAADAGVAGGHVCTGFLRARGATPGDRWELRVAAGGLSVHRAGLPCPRCWRETQLHVAPSVAYAFAHSGVLGDDAAWLLFGGHVADGPSCQAGGWPSIPTERSVRWPLHFMGWWHGHVPPPSWLDRLQA